MDRSKKSHRHIIYEAGGTASKKWKEVSLEDEEEGRRGRGQLGRSLAL